MESDLETLLACPLHRGPLRRDGGFLRCTEGCAYPVFGAVPFLLPREIHHTHGGIAAESFALADRIAVGAANVDDGAGGADIDAFVQRMVGNTNSQLYRSAIGGLIRYPIPALPLPPAQPGERLLDIGSGWGRWSFAAAQAGYRAVGLDPSLEAALAASRIVRQLGLDASFVVGDSRFMPFRPQIFSKAFSYSVLQHFAKEDVRATLRSLAPALRPGGVAKLHLLNRYGLRSLQVQLSHFWRAARGFETRYWGPREMLRDFVSLLGPSTLEIDGFFVQGRYEDRALFKPHHRFLVEASQALKMAARGMPMLKYVADNLFVSSTVASGRPVQPAPSRA
ncbi:MAG TPA: methyltransferase domain-containing protein [Stellaceae bacterium]|nr:methyltransferase domain-containing protein [Stellaceae bacterium]